MVLGGFMTYKIGQIFKETYPPEVAIWCSENDAYIDEIEPLDNIRRFKIKAQPTPTKEERQEQFLRDFFKVEGFGYYRRQPKGYQSAIESINTAYNISKENGGLPADVLIFYPQPDFEVAEQCTEQWLVANQIKLPARTHAQFMELYNLFIGTWNSQEHQA